MDHFYSPKVREKSIVVNSRNKIISSKTSNDAQITSWAYDNYFLPYAFIICIIFYADVGFSSTFKILLISAGYLIVQYLDSLTDSRRYISGPVERGVVEKVSSDSPRSIEYRKRSQICGTQCHVLISNVRIVDADSKFENMSSFEDITYPEGIQKAVYCLRVTNGSNR